MDKPNNKSYAKLFKELEDNNVPIEDLALLIYCDFQGNMKKPRIKYHEFLKHNQLVKKYYSLKSKRHPFRVTDLEVNGHDVMKFGITDGKKIGGALKELFECVQEGDLPNDRHRLMRHLKERCA